MQRDSVSVSVLRDKESDAITDRQARAFAVRRLWTSKIHMGVSMKLLVQCNTGSYGPRFDRVMIANSLLVFVSWIGSLPRRGSLFLSFWVMRLAKSDRASIFCTWLMDGPQAHDWPEAKGIQSKIWKKNTMYSSVNFKIHNQQLLLAGCTRWEKNRQKCLIISPEKKRGG